MAREKGEEEDGGITDGRGKSLLFLLLLAKKGEGRGGSSFQQKRDKNVSRPLQGISTISEPFFASKFFVDKSVQAKLCSSLLGYLRCPTICGISHLAHASALQ